MSVPTFARKTRLNVEALEERIALAWGSVPPATITVPTSFTSVTLNSSGDATGNASITNSEIDWYRFTATATGTYLFEATTPRSNLDTVIATYSSSGSRLGYNDDISSSNTDSRFSISLSNGQSYFFGVTNYTGTAGGSYTWRIDGPTPAASDDAYEENDSLAAAWNLGTLTSSRQITGLQMRDSADWFRFTTSFTGTTSHSVSIAFTHSQGDLDMRLYNGSGSQIGASTGTGNSETISLNGLTAGTYYVQIYGYNGAQNPNYSLTINPPSSGGTGSSKVLYLQFDGANISRADLVRYAGSHWNPDSLDSDRNGISIQPFLSTRSDRETIISQMISMLQADLNPYGITVQRRAAGALAVEGVGATTIFLGQSTLTGGGFHIACDIDQGNNNPTDIAFVGNEDWGSANSTAITLADVTLHEAGHTWGLWHVASGSALETMGLRYNTPQSQWVQDTRFLNQTFNAYVSGGFAHGPGPQNSHQTMLAWTGGSGGGSTSNVALVDTSGRGVFRIIGTDQADRVTVERLGRAEWRVSINGQEQYLSGSSLREIRYYSNGDTRDQVVALNNLGSLRLRVDHRTNGGLMSQAKVDDRVADMWARNQHGGGCGCTACAAASALVQRDTAPANLTPNEAATLAGMVNYAPIAPPPMPAPRTTLVAGQSFQDWRSQVLARRAGSTTVQPATSRTSGGQSASLELFATDSLFLGKDRRFQF